MRSIFWYLRAVKGAITAICFFSGRIYVCSMMSKAGASSVAATKNIYSEFQKSLEGIPINILAERLKRLQAVGIIEKSQYQERPVRYAYQLTAKGSNLQAFLLAMIDWGNEHVPGTVSCAEIESMVQRAGK
jgi:DNA-binding HxlR family transcriptional regulator